MIKKQKGITLIALIITILVMLILAGIAIRIGVGDNGILSNANKSNALTEKAEIYDRIVSSMIVTEEGDIDKEETYNISKKYLESQGKQVEVLEDGGTFSVVGKEGKYYYQIMDTEILILDDEPVIEDKPVIEISANESCVGCLVDINGDEEPDGIIYQDFAVGKTGTDICGSYTVSKNTNNLKKYTIIKKGITGKFRS